MENARINPALRNIGNPDLMMKRLQSRADEMAPTMRFLVYVCTSKRYKESVRPILDRLADRYEHYAEQIARKLNCTFEEIEPYVFMTITAVANYMIFAEDGIVAPQMKLVKNEINTLLNNTEI